MPCGNAARQGWVDGFPTAKKPGSAGASLPGRTVGSGSADPYGAINYIAIWKGWLARLPAGVVLCTGRKALA
jgi:hypothetical protein